MHPLMQKITREARRRSAEMGEERVRHMSRHQRGNEKLRDDRDTTELMRCAVSELIAHIKELPAASEEQEKAREEMLSHLYGCLDDGIEGEDFD